MAIGFKNKNIEKLKDSNRYCPICGIRLKKGIFSHKCSERRLKDLERERKRIEKKLEEEIQEPLTVDEAFREIEEMTDIF